MDFESVENSSVSTTSFPFTSIQRDKSDVMSDSSKNFSMEVFNFNISQAVLILEEHLSDHVFEGSRKTALFSGYIILILAGVCTNLLVSLVIIGNSRLRVARNLLIVNLSFSDLMLCLFCMPFTLVELLNRTWNLGSFLCRGVPFVQGITIFVSSATVSAIAIDRQHVIVNFSGDRKKIDKGRSNMLLYTSILWCFSVLLSLPIIFSKTVTTVSLAGMVLYEKCIEQWPSSHAKAMYTILILVAQFFIPSIVLTVTHLRIKTYLNRSVRKHDARSSPRTSERLKKELKRNNRATVVLSFISVVFACSWLPWNAFNLMADFDLLSNMPANHFYSAFAICHLVAMSSSVTNPILYGWFNSNVRRELRRIRIVATRHVFGPKPMKSERSNGTMLCENTYIRSSGRRDIQESHL
ncbi:neuropeptide Y receptor type 5-like [Stegodyphus dumicola]|uniref:neuropeptide Y receptor type 5-like n=1 Tax=Stegodyphus dumicola TaxID=202533 RepID=UPI0015A9BF4A|nr:neuropeptide Y receptor type 5-like [Stegodyphus dumicola]